MDELLKEWRGHYDAMMEDTAELREQIKRLSGIQREIAESYLLLMDDLEDHIKARALVKAEGHKANGVKVGYRKGYERISYDAGTADGVLGVLRDVLPETAKTLERARKSTFVSPSVSVKAID